MGGSGARRGSIGGNNNKEHKLSAASPKRKKMHTPVARVRPSTIESSAISEGFKTRCFFIFASTKP